MTQQTPEQRPMASTKSSDILVALDIGSTKAQAVVAEVGPNGQFQVIGLGNAPVRTGIKRGIVVNIDSTVHSIQQAVGEAASMAGRQINGVIAGITGAHLTSVNSASSTITIHNDEVKTSDVVQVLQTAIGTSQSSDHVLLAKEPQEYEIDGQDVRDPIGMSGNRLEGKVHLVHASRSAVENLRKCIIRSGLQFQQILINPHASSHAVLTEDEKQLGTVLVDIGAGTADIAIYTGGYIRHTAVIPIAGEFITSDIAMALHTSTKDAEEIKCQHGCAKQLLADFDDRIEVPGLGDRESRYINKQSLAAVIEPRIEEIFALVLKSIQESGLEPLIASGIVLTGGSSRMPGIIELAEDIFLKPVRRGVPRYKGPLHELLCYPEHATVMGLLEWAAHNRHSIALKSRSGPVQLLSRLFQFIKQTF